MRLPGRLCGASCRQHAQEETTAALLPCCCKGRGRDLIPPCSQSQECGGGIVLFVEVCLILNMNRVELISSL